MPGLQTWGLRSLQRNSSRNTGGSVVGNPTPGGRKSLKSAKNRHIKEIRRPPGIAIPEIPPYLCSRNPYPVSGICLPNTPPGISDLGELSFPGGGGYPLKSLGGSPPRPHTQILSYKIYFLGSKPHRGEVSWFVGIAPLFWFLCECFWVCGLPLPPPGD